MQAVAQDIPAIESRTLTILNGLGDVEITWDPENDDVMRDLIATKMKEGFTFFERKQGLIRTRKVKVKAIDDVAGHAITLKDAEFERLVSSGKVALNTRDPDDRIENGPVIRDAAQAARTSTVAVRPMSGG